jgi:hypothetical protein
MHQQELAMQWMLPHVQPDGVYVCEDLATSWSNGFGGMQGGTALDPAFVQTTMQGLIHQSLDWLQAGFVFGAVDGMQWNVSAVPGPSTTQEHPNDDGTRNDGETEDGAQFFGRDWWHVVTTQVKHIHYYNQLVVYEKGLTFPPASVATVGTSIPYSDSGLHDPVDWDTIMKKVQSFTKSPWNW